MNLLDDDIRRIVNYNTNLGDFNGKKAYLKSGIQRIKVIWIFLKHSLKNLMKFSLNSKYTFLDE